jgi:hypothetical protein
VGKLLLINNDSFNRRVMFVSIIQIDPYKINLVNQILMLVDFGQFIPSLQQLVEFTTI